MEEENDEELRVGVFVCHCGSNIGSIINCKMLADYVKTLQYVAHSEDNLYMCSETGLSSIKSAIKEHKLNRIVVAACTPRTHEHLFRECITEAGLNPYLFNFVNIREQCSWVHQKYPNEALQKAMDLIRMGVAKAIKLEPLEMITININPSALVIGAGVAGMSAAINLSNQGFKTYLVEKEDKLGGMLNSINKLFPHDSEAIELLKDFKKKVQKAQKLEVYKSARVKSVDGYIGNFEVEIEQYGDIFNLTVGAIIVAIGASLLSPFNYFDYDGEKRITQYELEARLKDDDVEADNIVMIQCVGSRNDERLYCSSVCCMTALKNAMILKEKNPAANVTILYRDLYTPGNNEFYYKKAREKRIIFIKYKTDKMPAVEGNHIRVFNEFIGGDILIPYDLLVLSTPLVANDDNKELAKMLKVPLESNNFFLEAHVKLRPNDFATDGIYIGGSAKWPVDVSEAIIQGYATAARAGTIISKKEMKATGSIAEIEKNKCDGCEICVTICPYKAINKNELDEIEINQILCKGCGVCGATCPNQALVIKHFTNKQIIAQIYSLIE